MAKWTVTIPKGLFELGDKATKAVKEGMEEVTDDLLMVAQRRTPYESGTLETSGTSQVISSSRSIKGIVSFSARHKGYNYALKMDSGSYKLGKLSKAKSQRGVRSKFSGASMGVGTGYLTDTIQKCETGYIKHIQEKMTEAIK